MDIDGVVTQEFGGSNGDGIGLLTDQPLLVVDGVAIRNFRATPEKILTLWQELSKYPALFSDWNKGDFVSFSNLLLTPNSIWLEVGETGLIYATDIVEGASLDIHAVFFDRSVADKVNVCREVAKWMFLETGIHRMNADVPVDYHATKRLLVKLGFRYEGTRRESVLRRSKWIDIALYGLTVDEARKLWAF
jgi:hypothetical protein